ncbi:SIMPL domain-containing protein [Pedobacter alpinus]|uniref:SIMPL domain-containing protein n=1 Tax=Pedobacter alpinus TaxID=1590643 RepID=A0ABW5TMX2_9SPHI
MKKILLSAIIALTTLATFAQNIDTRKKIEVGGSAEIEVTPDEIYIGISLKEYQRDARRKVSIEELEAQLQKAVIKAGIAPEDFMINNISAYTNYWDKKKDPTFLASKQYTIKVKDLSKLNAVIAEIDAKGIAYTNIERYAYSKEESLKQELKIKALKQAKNKATYLVESIGDKLGGALEITESEANNYPQPMYRNTMMKAEMASDNMPQIDFQKIKLSVQIRAVFEIK